MPEFQFTPSTPSTKPSSVQLFFEQPIFFNAGRKVNGLIDVVFGPEVEGDHIPKPIEKKVLKAIGLTPTVESKAVFDFVTGTKALNSSGAELQPGLLPNGQPRPDAPPAGDNGPLPPVEMLPMWNADP